MLLNQKNGFLFFTFEKLAGFPEIRHGIFSRKNGYSDKNFAGLNMSHSVGDDKNHVALNRTVISQCIGGNGVVFSHQVHQTDILEIGEKHKDEDMSSREETITGDGLVTQLPGKTIAVKLADCQAILMYDPEKKVVAAIHSGWRGSIQNIIGRCVDTLKERYGSKSEDLVAGISPSLGPCCCEFVHYQNEIPEPFWKYKDGRNHFNFWEISRDQLLSAGVSAQNIEVSNMCSKCNSHLFFSYRRSKDTGRFAAAIGLKGDEANP